jgi:uncharacterized protein YndB with AHSA1/START domain
MKTLRHAIDVRCPVDHAFTVFTEQVDAWWPPSHRRWTDSPLRLEHGAPARLVERAADGTERILGLLTSFDRPRELRFAWHLGATAETATTVRVRFTATGDTTTVEVEHREGPRPLPGWAETARIFDRAWPHVLASLQVALETA